MGKNVCSFRFDGVDVNDFETESFAPLVADDLEFEGVDRAKRVFWVDGLARTRRGGGVTFRARRLGED